MSTTTYYTCFVQPEPTDGPAPVYGVLTKRANGRLECVSRHATETEAIRAAVDARLAYSPPGTTADIKGDTITIKFHGTRKSLKLRIVRDEGRTMIMMGDCMLEIIEMQVPYAVHSPAPLTEDEQWQLRERPFALLQSVCLDYARLVLPPQMVAVIEQVAAGTLALDDAPHALGIRGYVHQGVDEHTGEDDDPQWIDLTPQAIREDAHRAELLLRAWAPCPGYHPARAVRSVDAEYKARIHQICAACIAALESDNGRSV